MTAPARRTLPKPSWTIALLLVLSVAAIYPLGLDNAVYQSMAIELVRFGRPPYLGSMDQNFPGGMIVHTISVLLFGASASAYRLTDLFFLLVASLALYRVWLLWLSPRTSLIAVLLYAFYLIRGGTEVLGQRDVYAGVLILAAAALVLKTNPYNIWQVIAAGLLIGLAVLVRPTNAVYAPLLIITLRELRQLRRAALLLALAVLPTLIILGLYSSIPGALPELYRITIRANIDLYTKFSGTIGSLSYGIALTPYFIVIPAGFWLVSSRLRRRSTGNPPTKTELLVYSSYLVVTLALILLQRKFLGYHFAPYVLLLTPFAALGIEAVLRFLPSRMQLATFVLVGIAISWPIHALLTAASAAIQSPANFVETFRSAIDPDPYVGYTRQQQALDYLNAPQNRLAKVEVVGFDARLRALLARPTVTRFTQVHLLGYWTDPSQPESEALHPEYQRHWRREFVDTLANADIIVLARLTHSWYLRDPYNAVLQTMPGFDSLMRYYRYDTTIGSFQFVRRK